MKDNKPKETRAEARKYEKPRIIWEDDFKAVTYAPAPSCAKMPLQSYMCDSRPTF